MQRMHLKISDKTENTEVSKHFSMFTLVFYVKMKFLLQKLNIYLYIYIKTKRLSIGSALVGMGRS